MAAARGVADADIEELLRRCHRDELLHLAAVLKINPQGKGLRDLASACARKLRWAGSHKLMALFRGMEPLTYPEVLHALCKRASVEPERSLAETEKKLLNKYLNETWANLDDEERLRFWTQQGMQPPTPQTGNQFIARIRAALGPQADYALSTVTIPRLALALGLRAALFIPGLNVPAAFLLLFTFLRPNDRVVLPAILEVSRLRQLVLHRVTIGVVGSPSTGKDAGIRAIFGIDLGNVCPVAGSTTQVQITHIPGTTATYVVNTPGLGDVVQAVTEEAKQVLEHIDVFVYVVNAQGGVQAREKADYSACVRSGRPVLAVVNKVDTLRERDRERYLEDARGKLGAPQDAFLAAAFDPLPQLSETPIGIDEVRAWLRSRLVQAGKDPSELRFGESEEAA